MAPDARGERQRLEGVAAALPDRARCVPTGRRAPVQARCERDRVVAAGVPLRAIEVDPARDVVGLTGVAPGYPPRVAVDESRAPLAHPTPAAICENSPISNRACCSIVSTWLPCIFATTVSVFDAGSSPIQASRSASTARSRAVRSWPRARSVGLTAWPRTRHSCSSRQGRRRRGIQPRRYGDPWHDRTSRVATRAEAGASCATPPSRLGLAEQFDHAPRDA